MATKLKKLILAVKAASDSDMSASKIARILDTSPQQINKLARGEAKMTLEWARKIAPILGVRVTELLLDDEEAMPPLAFVPISGEVAAGVWSEVSLNVDEADREYIGIPVDPRFPPGSMYGLMVRGTSINRQAMDGDIAVCLDVYAMHRRPGHLDWVVVQRRDGAKVETTIKQLKLGLGGPQLWPSSTDPRFQDPIEIKGDDGIEVTILALVLHFVRRASTP